jgi:protease II
MPFASFRPNSFFLVALIVLGILATIDSAPLHAEPKTSALATELETQKPEVYVKNHSDRTEALVHPVIKERYGELVSVLPTRTKEFSQGTLFLKAGNLVWQDKKGVETVLVDGSQFEKGHSISGFEISPDGKKVAFHTTFLGQDLRIWNVVTVEQSPKQLLEKPVENRMQGFSWSKTSDGLFYSFWHEKEAVKKGEKPVIESRFRSLITQKDELVFDHRLAENFTIADLDGGNTLLAHRTLIPSMGIKTTFSLYRGSKQADGTFRWESIYPRNKYVALFVGVKDQQALLLTSQAGDTYGISSVDITTGKTSTLIPAKKKAVLHQAELANGKLILQYHSVPEQNVTLDIYDLKTKRTKSLLLQSLGFTPYGDLEKFDFAPGATKATAKFSDVFLGEHLVELDLEKSTLTPRKNVANPKFDSTKMKAELIRFRASDGELLTGRLFFRTDSPPSFAQLRHYGWISLKSAPEVREVLMAVDMGGAYAALDIPGGGERGEKWFLNGIRDRKRTIKYIAEFSSHLQKKLKLKPEQISVMGRSWGGLNSIILAAEQGKNFGTIHVVAPVIDVVDMLENGVFGRIAHSDLGPKIDKDGNYVLDEKFWNYVRSLNPTAMVDKIPKGTRVNLFTSGLDDRVDAGNELEVDFAKSLETRLGKENFYYHRSITGNHSTRFYQILMYSQLAQRLGLKFTPLRGEGDYKTLYKNLAQ